MTAVPAKSFFANRVPYFFLFLLMLVAAPAFSQDGVVKKSKKTEVIEGKKYYLHTVEKGQTLYAIAKAYGYTVNDILVENPDALNGIKPGQVLRIPVQKPAAATTATVAPADTNWFVHKVEPGQTLYSISKIYSVKEEDILKLNPDAKNGLKVGQGLKIPGKRPGAAELQNRTAVSGRGAPQLPDTTVHGMKKDVYNVALMLPLQLWNVDNIGTDDPKPGEDAIPQKADAAVQFYEGALLAVDSMRRRGMNVNLHVYDTDDADSSKMSTLLAKPEFATIDLIIGPLSPGPFYVASEWAKQHNVAIISPVSPVNRVLFKRPDAVKALPSMPTQMEQLAEYIYAHHKSDNIVMINSGNAKEQAGAMAFRNRANQLFFPLGGDSIRTTRGMSGLEAKLKKDKLNVLVIPTNSQAFVTDLLRLLNGLTDKYPIMVYGLSGWMSYDNLDYEYLQKLQLHFVAPYFVDYDSSAATTRFIRRYDEAFHGDPGSFVFTGYDVTLFFLQALYEQGTGFYQELPRRKGEGLQQRFDFYRSDETSGYENKGIRIVMMQDYRLKEVR